MAASETKRRLPTLPSFPTPPLVVAAAAVGAVCGLAAIAMVSLGERGCDAVQGRPSCGGFGLLMLVGIIVALFLLGTYLLRIFDAADAGLVAFFGVTLPLIVILIFLMDVVFSSWMVLVLPLMAAACFAGSAVFTRALQNSAAEPDNAADEDNDAPDEGEGSAADKADDDLPRYAPQAPDSGDEDLLRDEEGQPLLAADDPAEQETRVTKPSDPEDERSR